MAQHTKTKRNKRQRFENYVRRKKAWKFPKSKSVRTVSGGLPSLGKRR